MLIKLIGSLLLALAGVGLAGAVCRFEKKRLEVLDGFISLLFFIKGQIDCYSLPISDILASTPAEIRERCMYDGKSGDMESMIKNCRIYLEDESARLLYSFAAEFGSTYRDEQLRRCDYYISALDEQRRRLADDVPVRAKVGSAITVCSALGLMIILW